MNKLIIAAGLLAVSSAAVAQQQLQIPNERVVQGDNPVTRTSEGGSSYYGPVVLTPPRVAQIVQPAAPVAAAAPIVAAPPPAREVAPAPVTPAPVTPEPVRARKVDRN